MEKGSLNGLPTAAEICGGLKRWRLDKKMDDVKVIHQKYSEICEGENIGYVQFLNILKGQGRKTGLRFNEIAPLLKAHGIDDWDLFVDYCKDPKLLEPRFITGKEFSERKVTVGGYQEMVLMGVGSNLLSHCRTRVDELKWPKGHDTGWQRHDGHEYMLIVKGNVQCWFREYMIDSENERTEDPPGELWGYTGYDRTRNPDKAFGVVFSAHLEHRFLNVGADSAEVLVGRPAGAVRERGN